MFQFSGQMLQSLLMNYHEPCLSMSKAQYRTVRDLVVLDRVRLSDLHICRNLCEEVQKPNRTTVLKYEKYHFQVEFGPQLK